MSHPSLAEHAALGVEEAKIYITEVVDEQMHKAVLRWIKNHYTSSYFVKGELYEAVGSTFLVCAAMVLSNGLGVLILVVALT